MVEFLEVYNENGQQVGERIERNLAHSAGVLHGASHTVIYKWVKGRLNILMQKRSANKDSYPNAYDLSSAGHVAKGEHFISTAIKELKEELGLSVLECDLEYLFDYRISDSTIFYGKPFKNEEICKVYALNMDVNPNLLTYQEEEVERADFLDAEEVLSAIKRGDKSYCTDQAEFEKIIDKLLQKRASRL